MRIGSTNNLAFKGTFYMTSDMHSRAPMGAGVLSQVQNEIRNDKSKEPSFLIDGGDCLGETLPNFAICDVFAEFKKQNPSTKCVMNIGNSDFFYYGMNPKETQKYIDILTKSGIDVVSAMTEQICKKTNDKAREIDTTGAYKEIPPIKGVKPYVILTDIVDKKEQKILVSGITTFDSSGGIDNIDMQKDALKKTIASAAFKHKPDKIILMVHDNFEDASILLDYAKTELGIENIEFALAGHTHAIADKKTADGVRVLFPPAQGKGAYVVKNTKNGFEFPFLETNSKDGYDYKPLLNNPSVIANIDISNPLKLAGCYEKILNSPACKEYMKVIAKMPSGLIYRDDCPVQNASYTTPLGTFAANALKEQTNSDIGLFFSLHFRERFPSEGKPVTKYNLFDSLCYDKDIYRAPSVSVAELKDIFETSLRRQHMVKANSDFFEYSNNLKIQKFEDVPRDTENEKFERVAQIYFKEDGEWIPLLNEKGEPNDTEKMFSVATCDYAALAKRESLNCFKNIKSAQIEDLTLREIVEKALNDFDPAKDNSCSILES